MQKNSVEHWVVNNSSGGWQHPAHIHFEEFQFLSINGAPPASSGLVQNGRKDVIRLEHNMQTKTFFASAILKAGIHSTATTSCTKITR